MVVVRKREEEEDVQRKEVGVGREEVGVGREEDEYILFNI